jgi:3-hydroxyacyl-CoA dehydrogenase/enoyl-CoA hydratase/3-hydroxybutyryl-CoA epimerase/3-hydroxyacyl-CoA dehydrogenase/enoyl-CoA hydratase/3-hydroxybutyryl-CoA epimerase/enoyl-CoA isomerase
VTATALQLEIRNDQIGVLTFDQPDSRANILSAAIVGEFEKALTAIEAKKDLKGLIFRSGKPGTFIVGADLKELGGTIRTIDDARAMVLKGLMVIRRIESLPYPTLAAVEGPCMGGGLEIALGFDYRLASTHPKTEIGLPEVKIGLFPGWGGTQRLPRVVGVHQAVVMITSGEAVNAKKAAEIGLAFDAVPSEKLIDEAVRLIGLAQQSGDWKNQRKVKQQPIGLTELQKGYGFAVALAEIMNKTKGVLPAPIAALKVIEQSCNLPLEDGLKVETDAFVKLVGTPISRNLIAVFFMNQRLQKDPGISDPNVKPRDVRTVGVLGAGIMGSGIAGAMVRKGVPAMMLDVAPAALEKGVGNIQKDLQGRIQRGRMRPEEAAGVLGRLSTTMTLAAMSDRDVVIEAVIENEAAKVQTYQELQKFLPETSILASNTSTISITRMAKSVKNPERFAGMHYFNPVAQMPLVEVIRGEKTSDLTVATLVALAKRIGKSPIVVKDCPGFLVNRILFPYINESLVLLEEGAAPRAIDKAATDFGMPMGPITLNDVVGLDTSLYAGQVVNKAFADRAATTRILDELVKAGRMGQKSGAGFYSYAKDPKKGADDPALMAILERCRKGKREVHQEEITDRLFLPMITEAYRVLAEQIVRDKDDVDMGLILGIGFPAWRGGLLRWADSLGKDKLLERLKKYEGLGARFRMP